MLNYGTQIDPTFCFIFSIFVALNKHNLFAQNKGHMTMWNKVTKRCYRQRGKDAETNNYVTENIKHS